MHRMLKATEPRRAMGRMVDDEQRFHPCFVVLYRISHHRRPAASNAPSRRASLSRFPPTQRMACFVVAERLRQHAIEPVFERITELLDANGHGLVARRRLVAVGAEQAIPPW